MEVLFVGVSSCIPDVGGDTACFLINGRRLVDAGWCGVLKLRELGVDPLAVESLILTHLHHDHYLGLPHLVFYQAMRRGQRPVPPLRVLGPAGTVDRVVQASLDLLQAKRFPELALACDVLGLRPGESCDLGDVVFDTCAAKHISGSGRPEEALSWRATERSSSAKLAFTGDTSHNPDLIPFIAGAGVLVHDAAHSTAREAAEVARAAHVGRLFLIHYLAQDAEALLAQARELFPESSLARQGERVTVYRVP